MRKQCTVPKSTESGALTIPHEILGTAAISEDLSFTATVDSDEKIFIFMYFKELEQLGSNEIEGFQHALEHPVVVWIIHTTLFK